MGDSEKSAGATAKLVGTLQRTPPLVWCHALRHNTANAVVGGFPVSASGDIAKHLNSCSAGTVLRVEADLIMHHWTTAEGKPREKITLAATHIEREANHANAGTA